MAGSSAQHLAAVIEACSEAQLPDRLEAEVKPHLDRLDGIDAEVAAALVTAALGRLHAEERLLDLQMRVDNAQSLANMGDYDWHIASDTNRWSDQLFRIYGYEPQSFHPSYARFLSLIHPEDQDRVQGIHQRAYATGEPYEMTERIVRPDGEVRHLSSNGQVVTDETGTPIRMRGTCIDITERVLAEQERERHAARVQEERTRRKAALEINDNVVQGLTAALYALEIDDSDTVGSYVRKSLDSARKTITDLVSTPDGDDLTPGDLVRTTSSKLDEEDASGK
jgi:PAS domain S-box-containing protein